MEPSRRSKRVSYQQLELLWEFLNSNSDIVSSYNRSSQEKENSKRKWKEISETLNSQGHGSHKDWKGWSKYWVDYKGKLKIKMAAARSSHARTGGGPSSEKSLSEMDKKFLKLLGKGFGQSLRGVRVDSCTDTPDTDTDLVAQPSESVEANIPSDDSPSPSVVEENIQIPPDPISMDTPSQSSRPAAQPRPHSSRRGRTRRAPPMSIETARRALVQSSQLHAEATVKAAESLAIIAEKLTSIERMLGCAFPRVAEQEDSD